MDKVNSDLLKQKYSKFIPRSLSIDCGNGWFNILDSLFSSILSHRNNNNTGLKLTVFCIKEKFGGLRVYYQYGSPVDSRVDGMIRAIEDLSYKTCETCGNPGKTITGLRVITLCESCLESFKKSNE